jgi:D-glycero-D-manno-heptose 1,7-bisphosphate phosphatase
MSSDKKAIFLDRDGVLIRERGDYTWLLEDMKINDGVEEALKLLSNAGFLLIVISNQSGIAKGLYKKQDTDYIHLHLQRKLNNIGIRIEEFYYCPHHPTVSNCICRKPESSLLEKAIARYKINPKLSWFIGDAERDIEAGKKSGVQTYKVDVNGSLLSVVGMILSTSARRNL